MKISVRPLVPGDAHEIELLYRQSAAHLRSLGDKTNFQFNARVFRRDGFGDRAAFSGVGAVLKRHLVGYLLYTFGYDSDRALRYLFVLDLLVDQRRRRQGIGTALMRKAAEICHEAGGRELFWAVYEKNDLALSFYARLGARKVTDLQFMSLKL